MARRPNTSKQTLALFEAFLARQGEWRYGYDLSRETGLKSGTLYPALMRLEEQGLLETRWEAAERPGRPPRHMYQLTAVGAAEARRALREAGRAGDAALGRASPARLAAGGAE